MSKGPNVAGAARHWIPSKSFPRAIGAECDKKASPTQVRPWRPKAAKYDQVERPTGRPTCLGRFCLRWPSRWTRFDPDNSPRQFTPANTSGSSSRASYGASYEASSGANPEAVSLPDGRAAYLPPQRVHISPHKEQQGSTRIKMTKSGPVMPLDVVAVSPAQFMYP